MNTTIISDGEGQYWEFSIYRDRLYLERHQEEPSKGKQPVYMDIFQRSYPVYRCGEVSDDLHMECIVEADFREQVESVRVVQVLEPAGTGYPCLEVLLSYMKGWYTTQKHGRVVKDGIGLIPKNCTSLVKYYLSPKEEQRTVFEKEESFYRQKCNRYSLYSLPDEKPAWYLATNTDRLAKVEALRISCEIYPTIGQKQNLHIITDKVGNNVIVSAPKITIIRDDFRLFG